MSNSSPARKTIRAAIGVCLTLLAGFSILYFHQHSMIYHPRPYDESYAYALPADGVEINYAGYAARHNIERVVLIAPFTTLREGAATMVGGWIAGLLIESYDSRANLAETKKRNPNAQVAIFHGTNDEVIPVRMGQELAREFPPVEFFAVENAGHASVLNHGHDKIIQWMNGASGTCNMEGSEPDRR